MAGTVQELIGKLKGLESFVNDSAAFALKVNSDEILDLNKAQMIVAGVDADGDQLGQYAPFTVEERSKKGLQTEYIDLRFTGEFQDKMELIPTGKTEVEFDSKDPKWDSDISKQWPDALGLTSDNEERAGDMIIKVIDVNVDKYLTPGTAKKLVNV
jgi:hypothetical protein